MQEGQIHAIITSAIGLAGISMWIADAFLATSPAGYTLFAVAAFSLLLSISTAVNYVNPDHGLDENDGETVYFGHHNDSHYRKHFDQYTEQELWLWRLWGYTEQLFFLGMAVLVYFVIRNDLF